MSTYNKEELDYIAGQVKPYVLEQIQTNATVIDDVELVTETDGITTLPAYDERGGVKKVVRVPLATFAKPAEEAAAQAEEATTEAILAAENANTAASNTNAIVDVVEALVVEAEEALEETAANLEQVFSTLSEITTAEGSRVSAENTRIANETARVDAETAREESFATAIENVEAATGAANTAALEATEAASKVPTKLSDFTNDVGYITESIANQTFQPKGVVSYPVVNHGTADTTFALTPNVMHVWGEVGSLTITLGAETDGVVNEYAFQFTSGATATTLTYPSNLKWSNGIVPIVESDSTYEVRVINNCAVCTAFR